MNSKHFIDLEHAYGAHNYHPIEVVISRAQGAYVYDPEGRRYLDFSRLFGGQPGHRHPKIIKALIDQTKRLTLTSRAFYNDQLGPFLEKLTEISGFEVALPMNTGAEAVETAIKLARRYGYLRKGLAKNQAEIIVAAQNFHGRTTTIVSMSTDPVAKDHFGPYTQDSSPSRLMTRPPLKRPSPEHDGISRGTDSRRGRRDYSRRGIFKAVRAITEKHGVLLMLDEIQTVLAEPESFSAISTKPFAPTS
jgi:ornithine--oxo-acid transaminase